MKLKTILAALFLLALTLLAPGCLSPEQRQIAIEDLTLTKGIVDTFVPPGKTHDDLIKKVNAATTVEQLIQIQKQAKATTAPATQPAN